MNLRHIEAFVHVATLGGFTRAAEALYLTQPTVSGQVKELEQELGVTLFDRLPRSVELTDAGSRLLAEARVILEARDRLRQRAAAYRGLLWGRLRVQASTIPGEYLLPAPLVGFQRAHPEVTVHLRVGDSAEVLERLRAGDGDLGVVGSREEGLGLCYVPLWEDRVVLYAAPKSGLEGPLDLDGLRRVPLVLRERGSGTRRAVERALQGLGVGAEELEVVGELGSTAAVKEAVKAGIGGGFLSDAATLLEVQAGALRPVPVEGLPPVVRRFYAVWDGQRTMPPAAQAFLEVLTRSARAAV
ncbi:MAG: selenium metabolism-associated LysR family transcriptional regulator [Deferrisomatales bacterium]|nr:selenium metabolism-associated LysR family transcriptional regulator [Deferrisomatales bacterium]